MVLAWRGRRPRALRPLFSRPFAPVTQRIAAKAVTTRTLAGVVRAGTGAFLDSVSCSSASLCTAAGAYETASTSVPRAERWTGCWRQQHTPGTRSLYGVSCPTSSQCTAVGTQPPGQSAVSAVLAMQWKGRSASELMLPY